MNRPVGGGVAALRSLTEGSWTPVRPPGVDVGAARVAAGRVEIGDGAGEGVEVASITGCGVAEGAGVDVGGTGVEVGGAGVAVGTAVASGAVVGGSVAVAVGEGCAVTVGVAVEVAVDVGVGAAAVTVT
jgi:hypothetical protein